MSILKRLSATYPMLDKKILLDKASELVAQHVMFGKPAKQVIDEIENMFAQAYDKLVLGGELWIVANRHLGHHAKLKKIFGDCEVINSNNKFVVIKAIKK